MQSRIGDDARYVNLFLRLACLVAVVGVTSADADLDPFLRAIPVESAEFDFERGNDLDFDGQPDDWARRTGSGFPEYVRMEIDPQVGFESEHSLRVDVNGGKAAYYSPPAPVSPHHSYLFSGRIRTMGLAHDAAMLSLSFLDARKERVLRVLSVPVSGTSEDWHEVRIGPVMPGGDVRYVVIGCHLVHSDGMDFRGSAWFDSFSLRMLPRLSLKTNFASQFRSGDEPLDVESTVSGLDDTGTFALELALESADFETREKVLFDIEVEHETGALETIGAPVVRHWKLPQQPNGFYRLYARLIRDGEVVLEKKTSLAILAVTPPTSSDSPPGFGWSVETWPSTADSDRLLAVASQAGIGWIKLPLWETVYERDIDGTQSAAIASLIQEFKRAGIRTVGVLDEPPREMRRKFAEDWSGVGEVFTMPPAFWMPSLEPVMARYSSLIHHWQLGSDSDNSFVRMTNLPMLLSDLKIQFDRLGRDTMLGTHWQWGRSIPKRTGLDRPFLTLSSTPPLSEPELIDLLEKSADAGFSRWPLLRPVAATLDTNVAAKRSDLDLRVTDLLRRMTAARIGNAEVVFSADVFHPRIGLLNDDASPSELYLPWRTWSIALDGAEHIGSFTLPNGSPNYVFMKNEEAIVCLWNEEPVQEQMTLGEDMKLVNHWGQVQKPERRGQASLVPSGPVPLLVRGGSASIARFRMAAKFEKGRMPSSTDEFTDTLVLTNPFSQGISGEFTLKTPRDWEVRPRFMQFSLKKGETRGFPVSITVPSHQSLGPEPVDIEFKIDGDRLYSFTLRRDYVIGLGDINIFVETSRTPEGLLEVRQRIENNTEETLTFRMSLFVPGQKRTKRRVPDLTAGESSIITYRVPNADALVGEKLRIRAEQEGGSRVLNKTWVLEQ